MGDESEQLTTSQVGKLLGYGADKVRQMCERGAFDEAHRDGAAGHWRITRRSVRAFIEATRPRKRMARA